MQADEAVDFLIKHNLMQSVDEFDLLAGQSSSRGIEVFEKKVNNTEISHSNGIGIRVFKNSRPGFAFSEKLEEKALETALKDAIANTAVADAIDYPLPEPAPVEQVELNKFNSLLDRTTINDLKNFCLELESIAGGADSRIENIPFIGAGLSEKTKIIANSKGIHHSQKSNSVSAGIGAVASEGEQKKMGIYSNASRSFDFNSDYMARLAVERAVELLGARSLESKQIPVLLSNRISGRLFSLFASSFYGESIQKGTSRLKEKIGQKIAVEKMNLISDPFRADLPGSTLIDDEGVPTRRLSVIEAGFFSNPLHNLESAHKAGESPTGNGTRGYSGKASTAFSNFIVEPGDSTFTDMLRLYPQVFLVTKLEGAAGCSSISGDISIGAQGFLCEKGEKKHPVEGTTISGNFFDLLEKITAISTEYSDSFSSVKVPDILVESMYVSG